MASLYLPSSTEKLWSMLTPATTATILIVATIGFVFLNRRKDDFPHANPPDTLSFKIKKQIEFFQNGLETLKSSRERFAGKPFRLLTNVGDVLVLPPHYAHSIRNEEGLSFSKSIVKDFHGDVPGFDPFMFPDHEAQILQNVVKKQLTKYLNTVTEPLSAEATFAINLIYGESPEWKEIPLQDSVLNLVARLSSRIFLGEELCRNEDWLTITKDYTVDSFKAAVKLTVVPQIFKTLMSYVFEECKIVYAHRQRAREIIQPVIDKRLALRQKSQRENQPIPKFNDAIEWAEEEKKGASYDAADFQLSLSMAAIHTTTDLISTTMILLAQEPAIIEELREEMVRVLKAEGWQKSALFNMKLLDSTIKEAQRIKPIEPLGMRRIAIKDVTLEDGVVIRKGQKTVVDGYRMQDPSIHANPGKFDIHRFLRIRETPGGSNKAQLVSSTPDNPTAFGHGKHACPGRFFAANETKIALCHLLLKYDWEVAPGSTVKPLIIGITHNIDPESKLRYRRRKEEINLESLEFN